MIVASEKSHRAHAPEKEARRAVCLQFAAWLANKKMLISKTAGLGGALNPKEKKTKHC
jgi:hypothetical protein